MGNFQEKFSRRSIAVFWSALVVLVCGALIYFGQISILYVLATLSLVVLLLVVAFSDLESVGRGDLGSGPGSSQ
jgi:heme O synthase-like polyprenyltransferase